MEKDVLEAYKKAGKIAAEALQQGKKRIKVGAKLVEVCDAVEEYIRSQGAQPAFPAQVSLNQVAAHYCPDFEDPIVFKEGDLAKLDVGVHVDGYVGDNALTVDLGDHKELVQASKDALRAALALVQPGVTLGQLGNAIQDAIARHELSPVKNLSGHGLDHYQIHTAPSIPNVDTGDMTELEEGMAIAIEPFATNGYGAIYESAPPTIFSQQTHKPVRSPYARELLKHIETYQGLPFAKRWLVQMFGPGKTAFGLRELINAGILKEHPPLPEKEKGLVSQAEHSILVLDKPVITTLLDE